MPVCVQRVNQEHAGGCGIAVLAMLTGKTYQQVASDFAQPLEDGQVLNLNHASPIIRDMDRYLAERGYAVCRLYLRDLFQSRLPWPPKPFADVHLCFVKVSQGSRRIHAVVMLGDGTVLDPAYPEHYRLIDYYQVYHVAAVICVRTPESTVFCE